MDLIKNRNFSKDLDFVRNVSERIDKKLSNQKASNLKIDKLTVEELQDLNKLVNLSEFLLCKYEDKKETKAILEQFVSIIRNSSESIEEVDDEVSELIISAEDSLHRVKVLHTKISEKYDFENSDSKAELSETGSNNLTNFLIEINSQEYQENSKNNNVKVI